MYLNLIYIVHPRHHGLVAPSRIRVKQRTEDVHSLHVLVECATLWASASKCGTVVCVPRLSSECDCMSTVQATEYHTKS